MIVIPSGSAKLDQNIANRVFCYVPLTCECRSFEFALKQAKQRLCVLTLKATPSLSLPVVDASYNRRATLRPANHFRQKWGEIDLHAAPDIHLDLGCHIQCHGDAE